MKAFALLLALLGVVAIVAAIRGTYKQPFTAYKAALGSRSSSGSMSSGVSEPFGGSSFSGGGGSHPTSH